MEGNAVEKSLEQNIKVFQLMVVGRHARVCLFCSLPDPTITGSKSTLETLEKGVK